MIKPNIPKVQDDVIFNKTLCICELTQCNLLLEDPIILPCGYTICRIHVSASKKGQFDCNICYKKHQIPDNGFPSNNFAIKILNSEIHLNDLHKDVKKSYVKLENILKEHESMDPDDIIYEYFGQLINKVDLHREQLIEQINKSSENIIKQLKDFQEKCKSTSRYLEKLNINQVKIYKMDQYKHKIRTANLLNDELNTLLNEMNDKNDELEKDIKHFKKESILNLNIEFKPTNSPSFGELKIENTSTILFELNQFSKFRDNNENKYSLKSCFSEYSGYSWRILAQCKKEDELSLGFFLECLPNEKKSDWSVKANAELILLHNSDPKKNQSRDFKTTYNKKQPSWGFSGFISLKVTLIKLSFYIIQYQIEKDYFKDLCEKGFYDSIKDRITLKVNLRPNSD